MNVPTSWRVGASVFAWEAMLDRPLDSAKKLRASAVARGASRSAEATQDKMADQPSPRGYGLARELVRRASL
ncbi:MAG: hypothetical protein A2283_13065 [Lentisphaerae bacterium RIFOXYA12_FULL_48_11]|nr:MAG: hypothetical protein A2283_13065 [Lentisphaerae bacterium RIFOXYA12_FULL_48_11]